REEGGRGLADRTTAAREADRVDHAVVDPKLERDPVAAERIRALVRAGGIVQDPEVVGSAIVLEDVVAVQVVHLGSCILAPLPEIPTATLGIAGALPHRSVAGPLPRTLSPRCERRGQSSVSSGRGHGAVGAPRPSSRCRWPAPSWCWGRC